MVCSQALGKKALRDPSGTGSFTLALDNRSGYDTGDLRRFLVSGFRAMGAKGPKSVIVVSSPIRSRGCAEIGGPRQGRAMVLSIAAPSHFSMRRLTRLFEHEYTHQKGYEHDDMRREVMWSLGPVPSWARGLKIRYRGRAPAQIP